MAVSPESSSAEGIAPRTALSPGAGRRALHEHVLYSNWTEPPAPPKTWVSFAECQAREQGEARETLPCGTRVKGGPRHHDK